MQLAGLVAAKVNKPALRPGARVIVCIGDSHTYGIYVKKDETYPAQLEKLLNQNGGGWQVINLGAPGQNSIQILNALPEIFKRYHPAALVVLVGVNNGWNIAGREKSLAEKILHRIKLYRLFRLVYFHNFNKDKSFMVARRRDSRELLYHTEMTYTPDPEELKDIQRAFVKDLLGIIDNCRKNRVNIVLMNYAGDKETDYELANKLTERVAERREVPLVDNYSYFMSRLYGLDDSLDQKLHRQLFFEDMHLRPEGYAWVANNLLSTLKTGGIAE